MTIWYLWAKNDDPATNQYLSGVIGEQNQENLHAKKKCADRKRRNLFECPEGYDNVQSAIAAIGEFDLKLEVFKEDIEGVIVRYDLWKKSAKKEAKVVRRSALMLRPHRKPR